MRRASSLVLILAWIAMCGGCRDEHYFGPYSLVVPTTLQERSAGRTFQFPLNQADLDEATELAACEAAEQVEPTRETPCICDFPVLTVGQQQARVDYRLAHQGGAPANVLVWVGHEVADDQPEPDVLPDLPAVEVLGEHHHNLPAGGIVDASFQEDEMADVDRTFATLRYNACMQDDVDALPAPRELMVGLSIESEEDTQVSLELTFRLRETD